MCSVPAAGSGELPEIVDIMASAQAHAPASVDRHRPTR